MYTWAAAGSQWKSRFAVDHLARLRFRVGSRVAATFGLQCTPTAEPWLTLYASWLSTRIVPYIHIIRTVTLLYRSWKIAIPIRSFTSPLATRSRACQRSRSLLTNEQIRLSFKLIRPVCVYLFFSSAKENRVTARPTTDQRTSVFFFFPLFFVVTKGDWITHVDCARKSKVNTETFLSLFFFSFLEL